MTSIIHTVPVEAVRYSATVDAARWLALLAAERAELLPEAFVELTRNGFVATVRYTKPGSENRVHCAHLMLAWAPLESARAV